MNRSTPGLPVHHHFPEFTQTHVHQVGDAIHPSHPLSSPFPSAPNPSLNNLIKHFSQQTSVLEMVQFSHTKMGEIKSWRFRNWIKVKNKTKKYYGRTLIVIQVALIPVPELLSKITDCLLGQTFSK